MTWECILVSINYKNHFSRTKLVLDRGKSEFTEVVGKVLDIHKNSLDFTEVCVYLALQIRIFLTTFDIFHLPSPITLIGQMKQSMRNRNPSRINNEDIPGVNCIPIENKNFAELFEIHIIWVMDPLPENNQGNAEGFWGLKSGSAIRLKSLLTP